MTTHCKWPLSQNVFSHVYRLKVKTLPFMLHLQWKKKKRLQSLCVCVWDVPPAGWLSLIDLWSLGNAFIPETADEADGEEDDEKRRKKKGKKLRYDGDHWNRLNNPLLKMNVYLFLSVILQMQGHFLVFLYRIFHSSICSIFQSQYWYQYQVIHDYWRLLRTFRFVAVV